MTDIACLFYDTMSATMDKFAWVEWLIREREKRGWSQAELARRVGTSRQVIHDYENRKRTNPDPSIVGNIAEAFGHSREFGLQILGLANQLPELEQRYQLLMHKISRLDPDRRQLAERLLDALLDQTEQETKTKPALKDRPAES